MKTTTLAFLALPFALLGLSACGEDSTAPASDDGAGEAVAEHNDVDVTFAQQMIPHHAQAIEMAQLAQTRGASPAVVRLAADVEAAQGPEIEQLTAWLEEWDEEVPDAGMTHGDMADDAHGSQMPGMMDDDDMAMLEEASGPEFDRSFLGLMIEHHRGAVAMAETEVADGSHAGAVAMARRIVSSQQDEIDVMRQRLDS